MISDDRLGLLGYQISKDLTEIQHLLGHASVVTTERYLGVEVISTIPSTTSFACRVNIQFNNIT